MDVDISSGRPNVAARLLSLNDTIRVTWRPCVVTTWIECARNGPSPART